MITLYHLETSRSERILWLMAELDLPYRIERLDREANLAAPARLKAIHPLGRAPVIRDGEVVLAESGAIVEYLTRRHGDGRLTVGPEDPTFADYLFWLHFAEGSFAAQRQRQWYLDLLVPEPDGHPVMARLAKEGRTQLELIEGRLAAVPYFAGAAFTAADIMMAFPLTTERAFARLDLTGYPHIRDYVARIATRPAYQAAMTAAVAVPAGL